MFDHTQYHMGNSGVYNKMKEQLKKHIRNMLGKFKLYFYIIHLLKNT